jgi:hypothetical protein
MPEIHIPLLQGINEGVDPKILPTGGLTTLTNARFVRDARIGMRNGYGPVDNGIVARYAANLGPRYSVYIAYGTPTNWWAREDSRGISDAPMITTPRSAGCLGTLGAARRYVSARNTQAQVMACDVAYIGKYIFEIFQDADYASSTIYGVTLIIRSALSHDIITQEVLSTTGRNPKITVAGDIAMAFWAEDPGDDIVCRTINTADLSTEQFIVVTAAAGRGWSFDIAPYDDTKCLLAHENIGGTEIEWGYLTNSGQVYTVEAVETIAASSKLSITRVNNDTDVVVGWIEGASTVKYEIFTDAGVGSGVVTKDSTGTAHGFPVVGPHYPLGWAMAWNGGPQGYSLKTFAPGYATPRTLGFLSLASKPFIGLSGENVLMWAVSQSTVNLTPGTYKLVDFESIAQSGADRTICEAVCCQQTALPGTYQSSAGETLVDPRRFCVRAPSAQEHPDLATAIAVLLPVLTRVGLGVFTTYGADLVRLDRGQYIDTFTPAQINGQLLLSGSRVREFDGAQLHESGLADGPENVVPVVNATGSMPAGTYQYAAIYTWIDNAGRRHRSPPSEPQPITIAASKSVDVFYSIPAFTDKVDAGGNCAICVEIYRTVESGTVFYLVNQNTLLPVGVLDATQRTYNDDSSDAAIQTNEVLYTQGARGGLSGPLQNDEPPPCRFIWPGNDRVIMGGLEKANEVRWSKLVFPGEPVQFTQNDAFKASIDEEVTAAAFLDGAWFIASKRGWWVVQGEGPDDSGIGNFTTPRRLPSDVGCLSQRSIVEIPEGFLFQGTADRIYLMPRGGGAPVWIAQSVRDTLAAYPIIVAAKLVPEANLVYFACQGLLSATILIYDTRTKQWSTDDFFARGIFCLDVFDGKLVIDGALTKTDDFTDIAAPEWENGTMSFTTGDVRPFGLAGRGRTRKLVLTGELLDTSALLTVEVSYDSGQTWAESNTLTLTGAIGDPFYAEHMIQYVKGTGYRFRISIAQAPVPTFAWRYGFGGLFDELGVTDDIFFDAAAGAVYQKGVSVYSFIQDGTVGHGIPDDSVGVNGDYYLDLDALDVYQKSAGVYAVIASIYVSKGGLVVNAMTLEVYPERGTPRLGNAHRT